MASFRAFKIIPKISFFDSPFIDLESNPRKLREAIAVARIWDNPLWMPDICLSLNLRDKMLHDLEMMLSGGWKAPELQELQTKLSGLTDAQKQTVRELCERIAAAGMHDLLFAISDSGGAVRVLVDGQDVAKFSDGLHGEIFGDDGWITRFSKYSSESCMTCK